MQLYDYTENDNEIVLFMEHCNDPHYFLNKFETRKKEIKNEEKIKQYSREILKTLDFIHSNHVVHADLKFPNLLL